MKSNHLHRAKLTLLIPILLSLLGVAFLMAGETAVAQQGSPLHPTYPLLDKDGDNVLDSGAPVSTMATCGSCHDAEFITSHSFHADVGLSVFGEAGSVENGREWDSSPGLFGKWNPLTYRFLSPEGDENIDLTTAEWLKLFGQRHVGGGPAEISRDGSTPLTDLPADAASVETTIIDPETGELVDWDWQASGTTEMNCFLCHTANPNNDARKAELAAGNFQWANTATLVGSGLVANEGNEYVWNQDAFDEEGNLLLEYVTVQDPTNDNCGACHGLVHTDVQTPLELDGCTPEQWSTITTGQINSPQRIANSGLNISHKGDLSRSFDVHAERVVGCTDCHFSLNNPVYYQESEASRPDHLTFDPRRIDIGDYLYRPLHQFAKGSSAQNTLAPEFDNSLRRCESCHSIDKTHDWLPYKERHTSALACETCHVPELLAPARQTMDWTVLTSDGYAKADCRGLDAENPDLIVGFEPVWLPKENNDGTHSLAPFNLLTSWYWVHGDPARPVPLRHLQAAWLNEDGAYPADILALFDVNKDGRLDETELIIETGRKETLIATRLADLGLENPRIMGEVQPYNINHNVTHGRFATQECSACHGEESRITQPIAISSHTPGGIIPVLMSNATTSLNGQIVQNEDGSLTYQPETGLVEDGMVSGLYILGHDSVWWIDWLGILLFMGTVLGVVVHGGLRMLAARKNPPVEHEVESVYMYTVYERLWHWLQTAVIFILLFTGFVIHEPDKFGLFSFKGMVQVHNIMALILVINAALALFYNVASGEIKQYLPKPQGFFNSAIVQAKYYLQGIFKNEEHPYDKTPENKLNPLQQATYFGLLNVLLPLQILTGVLMWGAERVPAFSAAIGGLMVLAPFHTLISWLLASFIVMHVYLTTTGHKPTAAVKAMMMGWDEVEVVHGSGDGAAQVGD